MHEASSPAQPQSQPIPVTPFLKSEFNSTPASRTSRYARKKGVPSVRGRGRGGPLKSVQKLSSSSLSFVLTPQSNHNLSLASLPEESKPSERLELEEEEIVQKRLLLLNFQALKKARRFLASLEIPILIHPLVLNLVQTTIEMLTPAYNDPGEPWSLNQPKSYDANSLLGSLGECHLGLEPFFPTQPPHFFLFVVYFRGNGTYCSGCEVMLRSR